MNNLRLKLKKINNNKLFHLTVLTIILVILLIVSAFMMIRYNVEGESIKDMPYYCSKISVVTSLEATEASEENMKDKQRGNWNQDISVVNDIFIYINKNKEYKSEQDIVLDSIEIQNLKIDSNYISNVFIKNNEIEQDATIIFDGKQKPTEDFDISNSGDMLKITYKLKDVYTYISNDLELDYNTILKNSGLTKEQLESKISFDLILKLSDGKMFKSKINLTMPTDNLIEEGKSSVEFEQLPIFKREKNTY